MGTFAEAASIRCGHCTDNPRKTKNQLSFANRKSYLNPMKAPARKTVLLSATLLLSGLPFLSAQDTETKMKPISAEELASRKASIPQIENRVKDREEQITILADDIKELNTHIESRIDKIVTTLASMKDSQNSKTRVAQTKQNAMKALRRTIDDWVAKRAELKEQLRSGNAAVGNTAAEKGVDAFDAIIEKRVDQMVTLSKSFTEHKDYKKYENDSSGYRSGRGGGGWGWETSRVNEGWKQNRRESTFTDQQRRKMIEALKGSIENLESRNATLVANSKLSGTSEETRKFYQEDIKRNNTALAARKKQLGELIKPGAATPATSVSRNEAHDTQLLIREIADDIRRDSNEMNGKYAELKQRLTKLNEIKQNLKARQVWLEEYEASQAK